MPAYAAFPPFAAWRFVDAVDGFEVVLFEPLDGGGHRLRGHTSAVEDGRPYAVRYEIVLDDAFRTRAVHVANDTLDGPRTTELRADGEGTWTVDGAPAPHLDGLIDVDLEASACTNTLPIHRFDLPTGEVTAASAAYVQALDLQTRRLDQTYARIDDHRFAYTSEGDFTATLVYDDAGLVRDYPGIATRFA